MAVAGRLEIELTASVARLSKDMDEAKRLIGSTVGQVEQMVGKMRNVLGTIGGALFLREIVQFGAAIVDAGKAGEQSINRLNAVLRATGNQSGYTAEQLHKLADEMARVTQFDDESFRDATAAILKFGGIAGAQLERTIKLAADFAALTGGDVRSAAETLGKALASPAQGIDRLQRSIGPLNPALVESIKKMQEMGDTAGAQAKLLEVLEGKIGGVAKAMNTGLTKATADLAKAWDELKEATSTNPVVQGAVEKSLGNVTKQLDRMKAVMQGDWIDKALALIGMAPNGVGALADAFRTGRNRGGVGAPAGAGSAPVVDLTEQDARAIEGALERARKAQEQLIKDSERLRQEDVKGWIAHAEEVFRTAEENDRAMAAIHADFWADQDSMRQADLRGHLAYIDAKIAAEEDEMRRIAALQPSQAQIRERQRQQELGAWVSMWTQVGDVAGNFFADLVMNGKSAFDNLKKWVKQLLAEMIALFAKRWVLQLAGVAGGAGAGSDSIAGGLLNAGGSALSTWAGGSLGIGGAGVGASMWGAMGAGTAVTETGVVLATGSMAGTSIGTGAMAGVYSALAAIPVWGWIAMAVVAIGAWIAGNHKGGPKVGGSFFQGGDVPGTDNGRFFTPDQGDSVVRQMVEHTSAGFVDALTRLGGSNAGFNFGLGFDHDPEGTARSRVSSLLTDSQGNRIYGVSDREMDDKEVEGALGLEMQRMIVAALQASDLHDELDSFFDGLGDVGALTGEQLTAALAAAMELKGVIDVLALWDNGLTVQSIRNMAREGETLGQTLNRVAQAQATYYQLFYTEEENLARNTEMMRKQFRAMGLEMPTTREEFRRLVEGLDLTTEAGARLYDWLIQIAPAFADITPAAETVVDSVTEVVDSFDSLTGALTGTASGTRPWEDFFNSFYAAAPMRASIGQYLDGLLTGDKSVLDPMQQLNAARKQYEETLALAQAGDLGAMGRLQGSADSYLQLARGAFGSSSDYVAIFRSVFDSLAGVADVPDYNTRMLEQGAQANAMMSDQLNVLTLVLDAVKRGGEASVAATAQMGERIVRAVETAPLGER